MQYVELIFWIVAIAGLITWNNGFRKRAVEFVGNRNYFFIFSAVIALIAVASLATTGLKKGLDFTGGSIIEVGVYQETTVSEVREALDRFEVDDVDLGDVAIQTGTEMVPDPNPEEGMPDKFLRVILRITNDHGEALKPDETRAVMQHLQAEWGDFKELRTASIGPTISSELTNNALKALVLALFLQALYIFLRFGNQFRYGLAADIALIHDVTIMVGVYSLSGKEIDSPFIAAVLTVVGYSVMDSVVVFDRIRENLTNWWDEHGEESEVPYARVVNDSINQTMTRSINTTLTTLFTLLTIYFFGGSTLHNFAFALLVGIVAGAYSSIFLAGPMLVSINKKYPVKPPQESGWGDVDEVVPEDFLGGDDDVPVAPKQRRPVESPKLVDDEQPVTGGRRRQRGKRT